MDATVGGPVPAAGEVRQLGCPTRPPEPRTIRPLAVLPLLADLGSVAGHRLVLLSLEIYDQWADLRFARIDDDGSLALPRRIPPADAWQVAADGMPLTVHDAVGRGDRTFSNGEVRMDPPPAGTRHLDVSVTLLAGHAPLTGSVALEHST